MSKRTKQADSFDGKIFLIGTLIGFFTAGVSALFLSPRSGRENRDQLTQSVDETSQSIRSKVNSLTPSDPVAQSMAEGKEAARRRRLELGLN